MSEMRGLIALFKQCLKSYFCQAEVI